jgi:hypothetical protein
VLRPFSFWEAAMREVPSDTILWGELWVPGRHASQVKTAIISEDPRLRWDVFASPTFAANTPLETLDLACRAWKLTFIPWYPADLMGFPPVGGDVEGYVLKDANLLNWRKYKPHHDIDLVVTDVKDGRGKYLGLVGALVCSTVEGHNVASVSGMTDKQRIEMSLADDLVGRICEVRYQYVGTAGRLRHPRFVRWREDKQPEECTLSQDPELEGY